MPRHRTSAAAAVLGLSVAVLLSLLVLSPVLGTADWRDTWIAEDRERVALEKAPRPSGPRVSPPPDAPLVLPRPAPPVSPAPSAEPAARSTRRAGPRPQATRRGLPGRRPGAQPGRRRPDVESPVPAPDPVAVPAPAPAAAEPVASQDTAPAPAGATDGRPMQTGPQRAGTPHARGRPRDHGSSVREPLSDAGPREVVSGVSVGSAGPGRSARGGREKPKPLPPGRAGAKGPGAMAGGPPARLRTPRGT